MIKPNFTRGLILIIPILLGSCTTPKTTLSISSGSPGSGYQSISSQIKLSADTIEQIDVTDNYNSQGSQQNLQRLLDKEVDFAIVQLDVASDAMKEGKVNTLLVLTQEYLHIVTKADSEIKTLPDLQGKRVIIGAEGSGIYFTSKRIFEASDIKVIEIKSNEDRLKKLINNEVDAFIYVGPLATSDRFKQELKESPQLNLIPVDTSLINYLTIQFPESYKGKVIPQGTYKPLPELPNQDLLTISTPGALITRPDVNKRKVSLLTWAIISNFRQYSPFYPQLASQQDASLLSEGLIYIHPGAQQVFNNGDPRVAWQRYLQENKPLQAAFIMLISTSSLGFLIRWWGKRKQTNLLKANLQTIHELRQLLDNNPQKATEEIEALRQKYRLMLIDGKVSPEVYEQIEKMTQIFSEQCKQWQEKQKELSHNHILKLMDEYSQKLPEGLILEEEQEEQLEYTHQQYKEMLKSGQLDLQTYLQMIQLTLTWTNLLSLNKSQNQNNYLSNESK
ncbi:TAXI family TRAP transporter solute-binding subunit [Crocosphaera sp.]|uniref:TAXI family TRAP transporter solute-binding subunit n=1 Tax=Crocosphaera sp. TaxID=2729996 RepID=UPI002626DB4A|nr:TAXI family TRAP transporter solute-binding subunit [Crocosphaera sp.]MDJ0583120.1 TAXI family TRAP transporter solute-binding subunit [Crocosphaera sp.]